MRTVLLALVVGAGAAHAAVREQGMWLVASLPDDRGRILSRSFFVSVHVDDRTRGPRPLAVLLHGRPADEKSRVTLGRARFTAAVNYLTRMGYVVAVPTRVGYGVSTGPDLEASGSCTQRNFAPGFDAAAKQTEVVIQTLRRRPDVSATGTVLIGHSYGGVVALATAARLPQGVRAVVNVSGGAGGDPQRRPQQPCSVQELAQQMRQFGRNNPVPSVWIYAENDQFFGATTPRMWFDAYRQAGGKAQFINVGRRGTDGHTLFTHFTGVWQKEAAPWLRLAPSTGRR
ncbi:MAG: alpha/beta hydrolase [Brachymonas sp.]|nr:alpha/beta hydrolase [Brachymonas sp.]